MKAKNQKNYQRQTSAQLLSDLPIDVEEKRALRKNGLFTEAQLMKYRKWFDAMDVDKSSSVNAEELASVLLSAGVMKYRYEVDSMFRAADVDKSGEISFEEFVSGIGSTIASGKLQLHRLDALVDETNVLSAETMVSQARREILMEHIIHNTLQRNSEIEKITNRIDENNFQRNARRRQQVISINEIKNNRTLDTVVKDHHEHRLKSMQTISNLSRVLSVELSKTDQQSATTTSSGTSSSGTSSSSPVTVSSSLNSLQQTKSESKLNSYGLVPLESLLDPSLWNMIDPSLRTIPDQRTARTAQSPRFLPPLETTPPLCPAAFQSPYNSLSFPPRTKITLHRIGSTESVLDTSRDSNTSVNDDYDDQEEDASSQASQFSQRSIIKPFNSTISLYPISKKKKISKLLLRKFKSTGPSSSVGGTICVSNRHNNHNDHPSQFYLSVQNRHTLKRNELPP